MSDKCQRSIQCFVFLLNCAINQFCTALRNVMNELLSSLYQAHSNPRVLQLSWEKPAGFQEHFHSPEIHTYIETCLKNNISKLPIKIFITLQ